MWKSRKNKRETAFDAERVLKAAHAPLHSVYALLHTSTLGLTDKEVEKRQTVFGKNERGGCKDKSGILASRWLSAGKGSPICRKGKKEYLCNRFHGLATHHRHAASPRLRQ